MRSLLLIVILMSAALAGCDVNETNKSESFETNLSSVVAVGQVASLPSIQQRISMRSDVNPEEYSSDIAVGDFIALSADRRVAKVFNAEFEVYSFQQTNNFLVVHGDFETEYFEDGTPKIVDQSGEPLNCELYALPKLGGNAQCLIEQGLGSFDPMLADTNAHYMHKGYQSTSEGVYFVEWESGKAYFWSESGGIQNIAEIPIEYPGQIGLANIFIDEESGNLCLVSPALGGVNGTELYEGELYCGNSNEVTRVIDPELEGTSIQAETRLLGRYLVTLDYKVDMKDLSVSERSSQGSNGGLPAGNGNIVITPNGGSVHIGYAKSIASLNSNGDTCVITSFSSGGTDTCNEELQPTEGIYFHKLVHAYGYAWTIGSEDFHDPSTSNQLRRIDLETLTMSPTNYFDGLSLSSMTNISFSFNGELVVEGTDASDESLKLVLNSNGEAITTTSEATVDKLLNL